MNYLREPEPANEEPHGEGKDSRTGSGSRAWQWLGKAKAKFIGNGRRQRRKLRSLNPPFTKIPPPTLLAEEPNI